MRNKYYLTGKNCVVNIGSGGADYTVYMAYRLNDSSNGLVPIESYFTEYADDAEELTAEIKGKYANHFAFDVVYFKDYQK